MRRIGTLTLAAIACLTLIPSIAQARYAGGDMNLYAYVNSNPLVAVDPTGTEIWVHPISIFELEGKRNPDGSFKTTESGRVLEERVFKGFDREKSKWWLQKVVRGLEEICPCVEILDQWYNTGGAWRATKLYGRPRPSDTEDSFCRCVKTHPGGCSLVRDLLTATGKNNIVMEYWKEKSGHFEPFGGSRDRLGRVLWNPEYEGPWRPGTAWTSLAHELSHAWILLQGPDARHPIDPADAAPPEQFLPRHPTGAGAGKLRYGEAYAVRGENQVGRELSPGYTNRPFYEKSGVRWDIPDYGKPLFPVNCDCKAWFRELNEKGWGQK